MKTKQRFLTVVQGAQETGAGYAQRLEKIVEELDLREGKFAPMTMPTLSAASDGRMTVLLTWLEEVKDDIVRDNFSRERIEKLQNDVYQITGQGEVMELFNDLLGNNAG